MRCSDIVKHIAAGAGEVALWLLDKVHKGIKIIRPKHDEHFRITNLHSPPDPQVDVVFVHETGPSNLQAWTSDNPSTGETFCWPAEELPSQLGLSARVIAYDYGCAFKNKKKPEEYQAGPLAWAHRAFVEKLAEHRKNSHHIPIIFVCQGVGGLVVKNALYRSRMAEEQEKRNIYNATGGIIFMGTPHGRSLESFTDTLRRISPHEPQEEVEGELRSLAGQYIRDSGCFKSFAVNLPIRDFFEPLPSTNDDSLSLQWQPKCPIHKRFVLSRRHTQLGKFSSPSDQDLRSIIRSIRQMCLSAVQNTPRPMVPAEETGLSLELVTTGELHGLGICKILETQSESLPDTAESAQLTTLQDYFDTWRGHNIVGCSDAWPVAILQGPADSGKTETALRYIAKMHKEYSSIIWLNATNRQSLKMSFCDAARRIASSFPGSPGATLRKLGLDNIALDQYDRLSDRELSRVVRAVTEWLESPQQSKWLLILDGLSADSGYPSTTTWTRQFQFTKLKNTSWREIMRLLPATTEDRGNIIICTRDQVSKLGPKIIRFPPSKLASSIAPCSALKLEPQRILEQWQMAQHWELRLLIFIYILSDKTCPNVPAALLEAEFRTEQLAAEINIPGLERKGSFFRLSEATRDMDSLPPFFLALAPETTDEQVSGAPNSLLKSTATRSLELLHDCTQAIRNKPDLMFTWDFEAQMAKSISAFLRQWHKFLLDQDLHTFYPCEKGRSWTNLAHTCEAHEEYSSAAILYRLERESQVPGSEAEFSLRFDTARMHQLAENFTDAEAEYNQMFSYQRASIPFDSWVAAYYECAFMEGIQLERNQAAMDLLNRALDLEDPFGYDASNPIVIEALKDMAIYLGNIRHHRQAAVIFLGRVLITLEDTMGRMHPETLNMMEGFASSLVDVGGMNQIFSLLTHVYNAQKKRLGESHPATIRCCTRLADVEYEMIWRDDAMGTKDKERAVAKKIACLSAATRYFGSHHPDVFTIRESLCQKLIWLGRKDEAVRHAEILKAEIVKHPSMYSKVVAQRIKRWVEGNGDIKSWEMQQFLIKSTLFQDGAFFAGSEDFSDDFDTYYDQCEDIDRFYEIDNSILSD